MTEARIDRKPRHHADNLDMPRRCVRQESVDLLYLRPSIDGDATHSVPFDEHSGSQPTAHEQTLARYLYAQGVRIKIDEAGFPVFDGGDVTAILETVDESDMPLLIEAVKRAQQLQR